MEETTRDTYIKQHRTGLWGKQKDTDNKSLGKKYTGSIPGLNLHKSRNLPALLGVHSHVGKKEWWKSPTVANERNISFTF